MLRPRERKELLGTTHAEIVGYGLCAREACAFSHAFCTHLRYRVTALKNKYTKYSGCCPFPKTNVHILLKESSSSL